MFERLFGKESGSILIHAAFRDVSGMLLPFKTQTVIANPMIGPIITTVSEVKLGVELPEGVFELKK